MTDLVKLPNYAAPRLDGQSDSDDTWSGYLTLENAFHVAARIEQQFGGRRFTVVSCYESSGWRPELRTGATLYQGALASVEDGRAYVTCSAAGTSFGWRSEMPTYVPKGFVFNVERGRVWMEFDRLRFTTFEMAPDGKQYRWSFMLEPEYRQTRKAIDALHELGLSRKSARLIGLAQDAGHELAGDY